MSGSFGPHVPSHASQQTAHRPSSSSLKLNTFRPMSARHLHCYQVASPPFWSLARRQGELAIQCQAHSCSLNQAAVIATSQRGLPLLLEAGIALVLRGAEYENEAAADIVFKPRSSGGLAAAIEYACRPRCLKGQS